MIKGVVLQSKNNLVLTDFAKPKNRDDGILVKVAACGVCGTDPHIFDGTRVGVKYPVIMGHEICGIVEEIGKNYKNISYDNFKVGDRITIVPGTNCKTCYYCKTFPHMENYCPQRRIYGVTLTSNQPPSLFGGFAEYLYLMQGHWAYKLPNNISNEVGTLVEPLTVSLRAIERGLAPGMPYISMGFGIGSNVVIQGAGTIGILAGMVAKIMGANVITLDKISYRLEVAKDFGASQTVNIEELKKEERVRVVKEITNNIGADVVIECAGEIEAFEEGIEMLRKGGRYVEVGHFADVGFSKIKPSYICRNDIEIVGSVVSPPQNFRKAIYILSNYNYPFEKLITHKFRLEDINEAIDNTAKRRGIKTVMIPHK